MYAAVAIYNFEGEFLGYGIKDDAALKLKTTNIYSEEEQAELTDAISKLNDSQAVLSNWPDTRDPDVIALLADESWHPITYVDAQVIDDEESYLVYFQVPELDDEGSPTGQYVDGPHVNTEASVIHWKTQKVAKEQTEVAQRTKDACEQVARQRLTKAA